PHGGGGDRIGDQDDGGPARDGSAHGPRHEPGRAGEYGGAGHQPRLISTTACSGRVWSTTRTGPVRVTLWLNTISPEDRATPNTSSPGSTIRSPEMPVKDANSAGTVKVTVASAPAARSTRA